MRLRQKKVALYVMMALTFLLVGLMSLTETAATNILGVAAFLVLGATLMFYFVAWRCPHCHGHLGRIDEHTAYCKHCGADLGDE